MEVPITISGILYDKVNKTSSLVALIGEASLTGLGVGGGPIVPPEPPPVISGPPGPWPTPPIANPPGGGPPIIPGLTPEHPIVLPDPGTPSHPIVIPNPPGEPPDLIIWPPLPNHDLPKPPEPPLIGCRSLVYSLRYGWALVQLPKTEK